MGVDVSLMTQASNFKKGRRTNATASSFASRVPQAAEPALDTAAGSATAQVAVDVLARGGADGLVQNRLLLVFFGTGNEDTTFAARVLGWRRLGTDDETDLWVPVELAEVACTLSATVGVAGTGVVATERFADTITLVAGNDDISMEIVSPTGDEIAHVVLDLKGFQKFEVQYDMTGATDGNCLYATY